MRAALLLAAAALGPTAGKSAAPQAADAIPLVKPSILAIGTFQALRPQQVRFRGTGFAVGDGTLVVTNAHVLPEKLDSGPEPERLVALLPGNNPSRTEMRNLTRVAVDADHDLALLKLEGAPLKPLHVRDSSSVREGDILLFTGFPIGGVLGLFPATHRAMVAAIAPIALPSSSERQLNPALIRRLRGATFSIFQLDATAYPGNSGSPLYDPATGDVVGIVNMVFVKGTRESALTQPSGITYAIPSGFLIELIRRAPR